MAALCLLDKEIVATTIALKYSGRLAWIGLVVSDPDYQRRGFARRLMSHAMQHLRSIDSVMLDASVMGFPLYDSMGFQSLYKINVYIGASQAFDTPASIRPMTREDLPSIIEMDCEKVGAPSPQVINWLFQTGSGYLVEDSGKIAGYTFTRTQLDPLRLVAWNARDPETAEQIFRFGSTLAAKSAVLSRMSASPEPNVKALIIAAFYAG